MPAKTGHAKRILDPEIWTAAKKSAGKGDQENWDLISHIYQKMGGAYSKGGTSKSTMKLQDLLKGEGKMNEVNKLRSLLKTKYKRRWKGKGGKWEYEYAKPKGEGKKGKGEVEDKSPVSQLKQWDKKNINDLKDILSKMDSDTKDRVMSNLPSANIPSDIDTSYPVWAVDEKGMALVGEAADSIEPISEIREYQQEQKKPTKKAAQVEPWRLSLMKVDNRR